MALFNFILGSGLSFGIGLGVLHLRAAQIVASLSASQVGGLMALLVTLRAEKSRWVREKLLNRSLKTWALFLSIYLGSLLTLVPALRNPRALGWLIVPLILSNGFCIILFGPIQDRIVRSEQRKAQRGASQRFET